MSSRDVACRGRHGLSASGKVLVNDVSGCVPLFSRGACERATINPDPTAHTSSEAAPAAA